MELYTRFFFLKKNSGFSMDEMFEMSPFEMDLFYWLTIKDMKEKVDAIEKARQKQKKK
jgi:hypothetical protein